MERSDHRKLFARSKAAEANFVTISVALELLLSSPIVYSTKMRHELICYN